MQTDSTMTAVKTAASTLATRPSFFPAKIMDPDEVRRALAGRAAVEHSWTEGKWYLCGDVQTQLFAIVNAEFGDVLRERVTAYATPAGGQYAVISHQILGWCHRFLLPLYEPKVMGLVNGLRTQKLGFSLGNEGGKEAVLVTSKFDATAFAPLRPMARPLPDSQLKKVFLELPAVIKAMNEPSMIPSMSDGVDIVDVSVSVVMPATAIMKSFNDAFETEPR
jgi:hypothetical protein